MLKASELIKNDALKTHHIIYSDSLATVKTLQHIQSEDAIIQQIQTNFHEAITASKQITNVWIPSHVGIQGNEQVDLAAKKTTTEE